MESGGALRICSSQQGCTSRVDQHFLILLVGPTQMGHRENSGFPIDNTASSRGSHCWKQGFKFVPEMLKINRPTTFPNTRIVPIFSRCVPCDFGSDFFFQFRCDFQPEKNRFKDDPELAKSGWYLATMLPALPNYVHESLEVVVSPNGQRGVRVTATRCDGIVGISWDILGWAWRCFSSGWCVRS